MKPSAVRFADGEQKGFVKVGQSLLAFYMAHKHEGGPSLHLFYKEAAMMNGCTAHVLEPLADKTFYDVKDLQQIMKISRSTAYELVNMKGFPAVRIGTAIRIPAGAFHKWIACQID